MKGVWLWSTLTRVLRFRRRSMPLSATDSKKTVLKKYSQSMLSGKGEVTVYVYIYLYPNRVSISLMCLKFVYGLVEIKKPLLICDQSGAVKWPFIIDIVWAVCSNCVTTLYTAGIGELIQDFSSWVRRVVMTVVIAAVFIFQFSQWLQHLCHGWVWWLRQHLGWFQQEEIVPVPSLPHFHLLFVLQQWWYFLLFYETFSSLIR